jgi:putative ubiquitin-RnfH superfamily antitoxin RatB of RatAB toxin-antitoxin module
MGAAEKPSPDLRSTSPASAGEVGGTVEVVHALPRQQRVVRLALPPTGLTAGEAVERSGLLTEFPQIARRELTLGIYGTVCDPSRTLQDGDRVEIYRPLLHDPRAARRERAADTRRKGRGRQGR